MTMLLRQGWFQFRSYQSQIFLELRFASNGKPNHKLGRPQIPNQRRLPSRSSLSPGQRLNSLLPKQFQVDEQQKTTDKSDNKNEVEYTTKKRTVKKYSAYDRVKDQLSTYTNDDEPES